MKPVQIRLLTERFRAIKKADIVIDGITVVAGENGCGKSTLSKLLYYLYKTISNYDYLVSDRLRDNLINVSRFIDIAQTGLLNKKSRIQNNDIKNEYYGLIYDLQNNAPEEVHLEDWKSYIDKLNYLTSSNNVLTPERRERLLYISKDIIKREQVDSEYDNPFELVKEYIESVFKEAFGLLKLRSTSIFKTELLNVFHESNLPSIFEVFEFGEQIVSLKRKHLSIPYSIQNVVYIDTPMMIGIESYENEYWNDLNELLSKKKLNSFSQYADIISNEIINGDAVIDDNLVGVNNFSFKRSDGSIFNLLDCATGLKSFSILQMLLKNGSLNDKTLLIIDEPESHLHPQWIIEYARLIVLLHKNVGIKFFIASHNPDMVSAIRLISEKYNVLDTVNFYLAENVDKYSYSYRHLKDDIDPIFESFNIALDRMNLYGGVEDNGGF